MPLECYPAHGDPTMMRCVKCVCIVGDYYQCQNTRCVNYAAPTAKEHDPLAVAFKMRAPEIKVHRSKADPGVDFIRQVDTWRIVPSSLPPPQQIHSTPGLPRYPQGFYYKRFSTEANRNLWAKGSAPHGQHLSALLGSVRDDNTQAVDPSFPYGVQISAYFDIAGPSSTPHVLKVRDAHGPGRYQFVDLIAGSFQPICLRYGRQHPILPLTWLPNA